MKILRNINVLKMAIKNNLRLGFVPTMGGLHKGHISLIKESQKKCSRTMVSIYVNPKQFNNKNDYVQYPRNLIKDIQLLKKLKIDYIFIPKNEEIYAVKRLKKITLKKKQKILCAKFRKGHFEGVLDIMDRFIKLIKPQYIFLGEKDFQQLFLIKSFIKNKYKSIIFPCKTIRDKNNAPLSTRNHLLSKKNLYKVGSISSFLKVTKLNIKNKHSLNEYLFNIKKKLTKKFNIKIEYLEIRNENNLNTSNIKKKYRLFIAYYINNVRLIDNF
jgi:pantoate--beta-alanine ligase